MKTTLLLLSLTFSLNALAHETCEDSKKCFQTDVCIDVVEECKLTRTDDVYHEGNTYYTHATFKTRTNIQYGCATNAGAQYIWEQAQAYPYGIDAKAEGLENANALALSKCQKSLAAAIKLDGACAKK